ncbi:MAG: diguanylate cyclase [Planctomycetia bacterium]|nr:diguanylate cyclase [Planctomycetia bacterium]
MSGEPTASTELPVADPQPDQDLADLIAQLDQAVALDASAEHAVHDNRLVQVRLGIATGLFTALRCKHAPTAAHSLRVALGCSRWALALGLSQEQLDELEVAALLHDIGKVGVPDNVMLKPGTLSGAEAATMDRQRRMGIEILRGCCASQAVLDIVYHSPAWFDGRRTNFRLSGEGLPLGARMLAIVDAFDSMTSNHVYRRALPRERALAELYQFSGSQFDPLLVKHFAWLHEGDQAALAQSVARRWLADLDTPGLSSAKTDALWQRSAVAAEPEDFSSESLFQKKLLENMRDGVVFVDSNRQIQLWNRGIERLTGLTASSVVQQTWSPGLISMSDENGKLIADEDCPVQFVLQSGVQSIRRLMIANRQNRQVSCDVHIVPVIGSDGATYGANLLVHDASPEISLEEQCQSLHEKATRDPMTQVANRAEFDRAHRLFVETHLERGLPCSIVMCDIDFFKQVNDTYGHLAGDEAIKTFAQLLKQMCRPGDLVARYGGEEFVVLCADCDTSTASNRAEQIRRTLCSLRLAVLGGNTLAASFGVTELQPGDTDETMLRRADRALLLAKEGGRNTVVQLGSGTYDSPEMPMKQGWWFWWRKTARPEQLLDRLLVTPVPLKVAVEKLRGFVADHHATIDGVDKNRVMLRVEADGFSLLRRSSDRPVAFLVDLSFSEEMARVDHGSGARNANQLRTKVHVTVRPKRHRDRRRGEAIKRARMLLSSLQSYLMAHDADQMVEDEVTTRSTSIVGNWLK